MAKISQLIDKKRENELVYPVVVEDSLLDSDGSPIIPKLRSAIDEAAKSGGGVEKITYANLKALRDGGELVPGTWYRITDYECTTIQENTRSAGHQFDILVLALDEKTLSEEARACQHDGDTYFSDCKLEAWKIWYCLDNDETRFAWADEENGHGVIYRMIDEWNNDVPCDFKNIQFNKNGTYVYTFGGSADDSLKGGCYSNKMGVYLSSKKQRLNGNTFGNNCRNNTFGDECNYNTFGNGCYDNTFGDECNYNTFGNGCYFNTFGYNCYDNTFGNYFYSNTFGDICYDNTLGDGCNSNTFGIECSSNTFGRSFSDNTFGNNCYYNTFGNYCCGNTFGNNCYRNTFGDYCSYNTFGNYCYRNTFGTSSSVKSYMRNVTLGNCVKYTYINCTATTSSSIYGQNIHVNSGVEGTSTNRKTITIATAGNVYLTTFAMNTKGELVSWCEADLVGKSMNFSYNADNSSIEITNN